MQHQDDHRPSLVDSLAERLSRRMARSTSRRSWLGMLGGLIAGTAAMPLLPVARGAGGQPRAADVPDTGDPASCDYWRYCAIDGFLCSCCGGSASVCPPGTEQSPVTWIGTCTNPADGRRYVISYNDCCGKASCGNCFCNRNEGDRPMYHPTRSNDLNWCLGTSNNIYNCSTAIIIGDAREP